MFSRQKRKQNSIVIFALETYSTLGGLQSFNQRVFKNIALRNIERNERPAVAFLNGDYGAALPVIEGIELAAPKSQRQYLALAFWASLFKSSALLICHINLLPLAFAVRLFRHQLPIVLFVHGCEVWNTTGRRKKRFYETWFVDALTLVASVSHFTAERMEQEFHVPSDKFRFLPNAVDALDVGSTESELEPQTILTVTRLGKSERGKNVHEMIAAVAVLKERLPGVKYEIVGGGALQPELEALAKNLGVADLVIFLGQVDDRKLRDAYGRAAVFAMPSNKEGFGIVYLEAWQFGKPVICSSYGAASEIVSDGVDGFVVDPANVKALADRLYVLLTQPELARAMGERGRHKVKQNYLNANFRFHLDRILDELLGDSADVQPVGERRSRFKL